MKKVTVGAIAVLFLLVGFGYASAQQNNLNTNLAGALTSLTLQITYEEELLPTTTLLEGQSFVTVPSLIGRALSAPEARLAGYKRQDDPIVYMWVDGNGNLSQLNMTWLDPNPNHNTYQEKIWTISCTGGNQTAPVPDLGPAGAEIQDGIIATKPRVTAKAAARTDTVRGVLACFICPDGFQYTLVDGTTPTLNYTTCNGGESYTNGYLIFTGTLKHNLVPTDTIVSASISGTLAGGSFDYVGESWVAKDCNTNSDTFECKANFTGTFAAATLTACSGGDPFCWNGL